MNVLEPEMVDIPAGRIVMGQPTAPDDAKLAHPWPSGKMVDVAEFQLGRYPLTNAQYRAYVEAAGAGEPSSLMEAGFDAADQPVGGVSWEDADAYCRWLADATGKPYRLCGDAQWEYAARGGCEDTRFPWGDELGSGHAWYGNLPAPKPIGTLPPNDFGLYDMIGNIWEWCADRYEDVGGGKATNTPTGKDPATNRVLRGASYLTTEPLQLWIAYRHEDPVDLRHACLGLRVAL